MPSACELKRGMIVDMGGAPHVVEQIFVQTPSARGGASLYKIRLRDVKTKQKADKTFKGNDQIKDADLERRKVQFLYQDQDTCSFMDLETFDQFSLNKDSIEEEKKYLTDGLEGILALVSDGQVLGIELPPVVDIEITECSPSMKGASVTARTKAATLSTGLILQVPEYLSQGETVRVDTRTGQYLSRA